MSELTDEQYGRISRALNEYCFFGKEPVLSGNEKIIFTMAKYNIDASNKSKIGGKIGGKKGGGGAPKGNQNAIKSIPPYCDNQYPPIEKNNSNGNGNVNVKEKEEGEKNNSLFVDIPDEPVISESKKSALKLAELLFTSHRKVFPDYLSGKTDKQIKKKIEGWSEEIEYLIRLDGKTPEKIRQIILWVKTPGNFWFSNIESGQKLRKQYDKLFIQMTTAKISPEEKKAIKRKEELQAMYEKSEKLSADHERMMKEGTCNIPLSETLKQIIAKEQKGKVV
jgi:hypothetical protein